MENKHSILIQSRILTASRYDYSVQEQKIVFLIIDILQHHTEGKSMKKRYTLEETLFGDFDFEVPLSSFMKEDEQNHSIVKQSLINLNKKLIEIEDSKKWMAFNLIERPVFNKEGSSVSFRIHPLLASAFLDFSKGYSKYSLEVIKEFKSVFSMRFYMLFSKQKETINYGVDTLKLMFGLEDKYVGKTNDFERYVIGVAKKELDKICPISFNYKKYPDKGKIKGYTFYPYKTGIRDPVMENDLKKQMSIYWDLNPLFVDYIKEHFNFIDSELKNNMPLFKDCETKLKDFAMVLSNIKNMANRTNPISRQGYLIKALRKQLKDITPEIKSKKTKVIPNQSMDAILNLTTKITNKN